MGPQQSWDGPPPPSVRPWPGQVPPPGYQPPPGYPPRQPVRPATPTLVILSRVTGLIVGGLTLLLGWIPCSIFLSLGAVTLTSCGNECGSLWLGALVSGGAWILGLVVAGVGTAVTWRHPVVGLWGLLAAVLTGIGAIWAMTEFHTEFLQ